MINVTKPVLPPIEKYNEYLKRIWASRWLTNNGEFVRLLEKKLREHLRSSELVLVSNGTLALALTLRAFDLTGEVITTPFTFAATTNVILWEKLKPVFADIDNETFNIDPKEVEKKITKKTSAILPVHVYGNPCYVKELQEIADKHGLRLIYDAAHAFDVEYDNQSVLNYGDASILSFHATKVFNTIEGGAIAAKDPKLTEKLRLLRNHGIESEEEVVLVGTNAKMNEFQAIMGLCNLEDIEEKIQQRRKIYEYYQRKLSAYATFQKLVASRYNYAYMPVCFRNLEQRDAIYSHLVNKGIKPRKYFFPLTTDFAYSKRQGDGSTKKCRLKRAADISNRVLCLPLYPDLGIENACRIAKTIESAIRSR